MMTVSFATGPDGCDIIAPAGTTRVRIMGWTPGQPGRPHLIFLKNDRDPFSVPVDASPSALRCLPSGEYRGDFLDGAGKKHGTSFAFTIQHLRDEPESEKANSGPSIDPVLQQTIDRLEARIDSLLGAVKDMLKSATAVVDKAMNTQIEVVKVMPEAMRATAKLISAANGRGGLVEAASELQDIWENAPVSDNNLETVLNSPVVVGAAAALQKYMAKAAENSAEAAANGSGRRRENMAERVARMSAAADDAALRRASART